MKLKIVFSNNNILVTVIFRLPATCPIEFISASNSYLSENLHQNVNYLIADINIDINAINIISYEYQDILSKHGYAYTTNQ